MSAAKTSIENLSARYASQIQHLLQTSKQGKEVEQVELHLREKDMLCSLVQMH